MAQTHGDLRAAPELGGDVVGISLITCNLRGQPAGSRRCGPTWS